MHASRRCNVLVFTLAAILIILFVTSFRNLQSGTRDPTRSPPPRDPSLSKNTLSSPAAPGLSHSTLKGSAIASPLGNETAKAELGRAAWKLFHTVFARFPEAPTPDEQLALESWVHLFARLYPCGECASHFQAVLGRFPPQVASRNVAAAWGCHVHNEVNKSLGKENFDCNDIGEWYDCGCADGDGETKGKQKEVKRTEEVPIDERDRVKLDERDRRREDETLLPARMWVSV